MTGVACGTINCYTVNFYGVVNHLLEDDGKMMRAAKKGDSMYTFKSRELASALAEGLRQSFEEWNEESPSTMFLFMTIGLCRPMTIVLPDVTRF